MCNTVVSVRDRLSPEQAFTLFVPSSQTRPYQPTTRLRDLKDLLWCFLLGLGVQVGLGACMFGDLFSLGKKGGQRIQVGDKGGEYLSPSLVGAAVPHTHPRPLPEGHLTFRVDSPHRAASPSACPARTRGDGVAVGKDWAASAGSC